MKQNEEKMHSMTNEEYRTELRRLFDNINENYKLKWFYGFVVEKIRSSN